MNFKILYTEFVTAIWNKWQGQLTLVLGNNELRSVFDKQELLFAGWCLLSIALNYIVEFKK